jgi:alpha-1,3-rhamnosyl/mannosyltransferase
MTERALHIGVDGRELLGHATGVGRYLHEILRGWTGDAAWPHRLSIVVPAAPPDALVAALGPRASWIVASSPTHGTVWEQWHLPRALRRARTDVLLASAYTAPILCPCPFVVVIYDVSYFAHPEWFGAREGLRRRGGGGGGGGRAGGRPPPPTATISAFSAAEIERFVGVPASQILLVPPGAPAAAAGAQTAGAAREPLVLFVGSLFTRRHVPDLIAGFAQAAAQVPGARLVLAGDNRTSPRIDPHAVAGAAGVGDRVDWRAYVDDAERDRLYRSARVFAFLSDYEGFAMTPMEALAHGVAPVLLDTPVAREVYGDAARYVSAEPAAIGSALTSLLTDDPARRAIVDAGRARLAQLSWARSSAVLRAALERAGTRR